MHMQHSHQRTWAAAKPELQNLSRLLTSLERLMFGLRQASMGGCFGTVTCVVDKSMDLVAHLSCSTQFM